MARATRTFHPKEVCRLIGVSRSRLQRWDRGLRLIEPVHDGHAGCPRGYSLQNVYEFGIAAALTVAGFPDERLQQIAADLHRTLAPVPARQRAAATLIKYVQIVETLARLLRWDRDPVYRAWIQDASAMMSRAVVRQEPIVPPDDFVFLPPLRTDRDDRRRRPDRPSSPHVD